MFLNEQFKELQSKFSAMEVSYNQSKTEFDASAVKVTALTNQIADLTKVKTDLETKLKVYGENPNVLTELNTKIETLTKEKTEASNKLTEFQTEMETKINVKAAEIIASGKVQSPLPITADIQPEVDMTAFLEELEKKSNTQAKAKYIGEHPKIWKEVLTARENYLKGRK